MNTPAKSTIRCALYTRKSSEEGLDQSFNSLHAQREACEAYVASQRHEGWQALSTQYDDGGFSGGNMERPGLVELLADIATHKVDTVVVYKVDRLTRSLADFAKIVEAFDKQGVSFVSVTQQFNTTSSMGRLTLNILLSFAQFEREVTGERIRDKISASKKKGMWMGGTLPLGYDCKDHRLLVNPKEAKLVKEIFTQYLKLGSVFELKEYLNRKGLRSKARVSASGNKHGDAPFGRGALYHLLSNPIYVGDISHKEQIYPGKHEAILSRKLWEQVAAKLKANSPNPSSQAEAKTPSMLTGLLFDANGVRYTPQHSLKNGRRHHYYASQSVLHKTKGRTAIPRISATRLESIVSKRILSFLRSPQELTSEYADAGVAELQPLIHASGLKAAQIEGGGSITMQSFIQSVVPRIVVGERDLEIHTDGKALQEILLGRSLGQGNAAHSFVLITSAEAKPSGNKPYLVIHSSRDDSDAIKSRMKTSARIRQWLDLIIDGECLSFEDLARRTGLTASYLNRILKTEIPSQHVAVR